MIEPVTPDSDEIDVVGQTHHEAVACRRRRNFDQRHTCVQNPRAKHSDVKIQCGHVRVLSGLTNSQQESHFLEQVVAEPNDRRAIGLESKTGDAGVGGRLHRSCAATRERQ